MKIHDIITERAYIGNDVTRILKQKGYKKLGGGAEQMAFLEPGTGLVLKIFGTSGSNKDSGEDKPNAAGAQTYDRQRWVYGDDSADPLPSNTNDRDTEIQRRKELAAKEKEARRRILAAKEREERLKNPPKRPPAGTPLELSFPQKTFKAFADYCMKHPNNPFLPQFFGWHTFELNNHTYLQIRTERLFPFGKKNEIGYVLSDMADAAKRSDGRPDQLWTWWEEYSSDSDNPDNNYQDDAIQELQLQLSKKEMEMLWKTIYDLSEIASWGNFYLDLHDDNFMLGSDGHIVINDPFFSGGMF